MKCDVRKYFENIDHAVLLDILRNKISDKKVLNLLEIIIRSFNTESGKGIPLGNITSQVFTNIYLKYSYIELLLFLSLNNILTKIFL